MRKEETDERERIAKEKDEKRKIREEKKRLSEEKKRLREEKKRLLNLKKSIQLAAKTSSANIFEVDLTSEVEKVKVIETSFPLIDLTTVSHSYNFNSSL